MDRLNRTLAALGLGLWVATTATGCRSTKSEVPPGRPYLGDGRQAPPVGFSTEPGMPTGAMAGLPDPNNPAKPATNFGPLQDNAGAMTNYGAPTANRYGPPGTSTGSPPTAPPSTNLAPEYDVKPASAPGDLAPPLEPLPSAPPAAASPAPRTASAPAPSNAGESMLPAEEPVAPLSLPSAPPGSEGSTAPSPF